MGRGASRGVRGSARGARRAFRDAREGRSGAGRAGRDDAARGARGWVPRAIRQIACSTARARAGDDDSGGTGDRDGAHLSVLKIHRRLLVEHHATASRHGRRGGSLVDDVQRPQPPVHLGVDLHGGCRSRNLPKEERSGLSSPARSRFERVDERLWEPRIRARNEVRVVPPGSRARAHCAPLARDRPPHVSGTNCARMRTSGAAADRHDITR